MTLVVAPTFGDVSDSGTKCGRAFAATRPCGSFFKRSRNDFTTVSSLSTARRSGDKSLSICRWNYRCAVDTLHVRPDAPAFELSSPLNRSHNVPARTYRSQPLRFHNNRPL